MSRKTVTLPTSNLPYDLSTEESQGYTQFVDALNIQLNIQLNKNMDQEQEDFNNNEQEEESPPLENPPSEIKGLPQETRLRYVPINV